MLLMVSSTLSMARQISKHCLLNEVTNDNSGRHSAKAGKA